MYNHSSHKGAPSHVAKVTNHCKTSTLAQQQQQLQWLKLQTASPQATASWIIRRAISNGSSNSSSSSSVSNVIRGLLQRSQWQSRPSSSSSSSLRGQGSRGFWVSRAFSEGSTSTSSSGTADASVLAAATTRHWLHVVRDSGKKVAGQVSQWDSAAFNVTAECATWMMQLLCQRHVYVCMCVLHLIEGVLSLRWACYGKQWSCIPSIKPACQCRCFILGSLTQLLRCCVLACLPMA